MRLVVASVLKQHPAARIDRALASLVTERTEAVVVRSIDPARVLAEAWNAFRLDRCRDHLAAGEQAPAIRVVGYRIAQETLYGVIDGMHRTIAHREAGRKIKARIEGYARVDPQSYLLWRGLLWRACGDGLRGIEVTEDLHGVLVALGVPIRTDPAPADRPDACGSSL